MNGDELEQAAREVRRGPGVRDAWHRKVVEDRLDRIKAMAEDDARVAQIAEATGSTSSAVRQAEAEDAARKREREWARQLEAARRGVSPALRKRRGRTYWTQSLYLARLADAEARTPEPQTDEAVARRFVGLNKEGAEGIDADSLARLRRRAERGDLPTE